VLRQVGLHHDLGLIYKQINEEYFGGELDLHITWSGNARLLPRGSIRLGSYHPHAGLIKIHRVLDREHIPVYFISSIVYHEMLHHVVPPLKPKKGRRQIHHPEFRQREKQFKEYQLAQEFSRTLTKSLFKR
jgi:hypothetical protein